MTHIRQHLLSILMLALVAGCGPSALSPGNAMPHLQVAGWTNGVGPTSADLAGKVIVLEVFATW